jgi:spore coat polysaccharide biosynthesis protein SpsF
MVAGQLNKVVAIIQARMQSTRLPGKVLMPMPFPGDISILEQIVNQLRKSRLKPTIVIATSESCLDNDIEIFCKTKNILFYRGDENDVHSRFFEILHNSNYDTVVRATGDNPIIDVEYLDLVLQKHIKSNSDYSFTKDLPTGMNFEVFDTKAFLKMSTLDLSFEDKEHVTLRFKSDKNFVKNLIKIDSNIKQDIRVTIDYPSDYLLLSSLFGLSKKYNIEPSLKLIRFVLNKYPWLFQVNKNNFQKKQFSSLYEEVAYSVNLLKSLDLRKSAQYLSDHAGI